MVTQHQTSRMDVVLKLHNPALNDPTVFYILPFELLTGPMIGLHDRYLEEEKLSHT